MADFADPNLLIEELSVSELEVVVYKDTAIVTGISHVEGCESDNPLTGEYRFTRTWRLSDGDWRVIAAQTSHIDT
jgi:ketosteroid isomerase-like protein